jgi:hypothetical protein
VKMTSPRAGEPGTGTGAQEPPWSPGSGDREEAAFGSGRPMFQRPNPPTDEEQARLNGDLPPPPGLNADLPPEPPPPGTPRADTPRTANLRGTLEREAQRLKERELDLLRRENEFLRKQLEDRGRPEAPAAALPPPVSLQEKQKLLTFKELTDKVPPTRTGGMR